MYHHHDWLEQNAGRDETENDQRIVTDIPVIEEWRAREPDTEKTIDSVYDNSVDGLPPSNATRTKQLGRVVQAKRSRMLCEQVRHRGRATASRAGYFVNCDSHSSPSTDNLTING
jgi:hypothetical protein